MDTDVIVVGAGVNGLGAAALLATKGRSVLVVEANDVPGGAVRTGEVTLPGFRHDLFAMNLGLFAGGPINAALGERLGAHGLEFVPSSKPFCSVFPDGTMLGVEADVEATVANIREIAPQDVASWERLTEYLATIAPTLIGVLGSDLPSWSAAKTLWKAHRQFGTAGVLDIAKLALSSTRAFTEENFSSPKVRALMASWGMHLDFAPDIAGGALFSFLEAIGGQFNGMVIGRGGAESMIDALVAIIEENGGRVVTGQRVTEILTEGSTAVGVRTESGEVYRARRAVVANLNPRLLPAMLPENCFDAVGRQRGEIPPGLGDDDDPSRHGRSAGLAGGRGARVQLRPHRPLPRRHGDDVHASRGGTAARFADTRRRSADHH